MMIGNNTKDGLARNNDLRTAQRSFYGFTPAVFRYRNIKSVGEVRRASWTGEVRLLGAS